MVDFGGSYWPGAALLDRQLSAKSSLSKESTKPGAIQSVK